MNSEVIKEAFKMIDGEIMVAPVDHAELEELRRSLLFKVHMIEQMMALQKVA